jgi:signal transduction histidine kinase
MEDFRRGSQGSEGEPDELALDEIRRELARELHDSVAQTLSTMLLELDTFRAEQYGRAGVLRAVDQIERSTRKALRELRELLVELRTQRLAEVDLTRLLRSKLRQREEGKGSLRFELKVARNWPRRMPGRVAAELYRLIDEAVENGVRHSGATRIAVALRLGDRGQRALVTVSDDGRGLPSHKGLRLGPGLGIVGMRERADLLGGEVELESGPDGIGTTVRVTVPLQTPA